MDGGRPRSAEAVAALVAAGLTVTMDHAGPLLPIFLAAAVTVLWMRRAPLAVAWIGAGTAVALPVLAALAPATVPRLEGVLMWPPAGAFAAYGAMAYGAARQRRYLRWLPVATLALGVLLITALPGVTPLVLRTEVAIALAVLYGLYTEVRARLRRELHDRAERVERERLAGEMHEVVTHRVSRMILQARALAGTSGDPRVRAAAEEFGATATQALDELRHMVALLRRANGEGFDHGLPLPDLRSLISASGRDGVPAELSVAGPQVPIAGAVGRTAYRVVQAALANVRDHAPGAEARVEVRYLPGVLRITVHSTPPGGAEDERLDQVRQWVELAGGTLRSGPAEDGGFIIEATLPTSPP